MSALPALNTEMANLRNPTGVHGQHMTQHPGLPVQASIGQQLPQPHQVSSHQVQQHYGYQYPAQQFTANNASAQPNTGAGTPYVVDVKPTLEEADDQPWR